MDVHTPLYVTQVTDKALPQSTGKCSLLEAAWLRGGVGGTDTGAYTPSPFPAHLNCWVAAWLGAGVRGMDIGAYTPSPFPAHLKPSQHH